MISDVLSEMIEGLDEYLNNPAFDLTYTGELRERILSLRTEAKAVQKILDTPPLDS